MRNDEKGNVAGNWSSQLRKSSLTRHTTHDMLHGLQGFSEHLHDEAHEALLARRTKRMTKVGQLLTASESFFGFFLMFFVQNRTRDDIPGYFAWETCKVSLSVSHIVCLGPTAHLLAAPEELCKPLRLLRLSQYPQFGVRNILGTNFHRFSIGFPSISIGSIRCLFRCFHHLRAALQDMLLMLQLECMSR